MLDLIEVVSPHIAEIALDRTPTIIAVSRSPGHTMAKANHGSISLIAGLGVDGDVHQGTTLKQSFRRLRFGSQPNLRQVHLLTAELHDELRELGFNIAPGQMGENITTRGLNLLDLPTGTRLHLGTDAVIEFTGLRHPCGQLNKIQPGLMKATLDRDAAGRLIRKAGVFAIVCRSGAVRPGDSLGIEFPSPPHRPLCPI
jgi:hypothetical protein